MSDSKILTADEYVYGNIVLDPVPEELPDRRKKRKVQTRDIPQAKPKTSKAYPISFGVVFGLLFVSLLCSLHVRSLKMTVRENISELESSISTLQSENDSLQYTIENSLDTNYIYKVATKKLGMVQAQEDQISTYSSASSGYTIQYQDIPEE